MDTINKLLVIATSLNIKDIANKIERIKERSKQENVELIFPLIGEFSAGKTTLINALTDSKQLETATQPTTASIYEIHFGCERCYANIVNTNGETKEVENLSELKNETLADAKIIHIYDTSTCVPATTVLVDTPGLSSLNPQHKQTLIDFLPYSDGALLVVDINQQITRSITDFIETMKLTKRPIYLILAKCDTKSPKEIEQAKKYICENCKVPLQQITCVAATQNNLKELYTLLEAIQKEKSSIIEQVDKQRIKNIVKILLEYINNLLKNTSSAKRLDEAIQQLEFDLNQLNRNIDHLLEDMEEDINEIERNVVRQFEDLIFEKLDALVAQKSNDFDTEAISTINTTANILLNDYKQCIQTALHNKIRARNNTKDAISLRSLEDINLSEISINQITYNINLNSIGHQYDGIVATGVKIAAAVGAVAVGAATLGIGGAAGSAVATGKLIDVADTASDVTSMISNRKTVKRIEKAANMIKNTSEQLSGIDEYNQKISQQIGNNKGIVESLVGFFTDKVMGKPQRRKVIHNYIDEILIPDFTKEMRRIGLQLINMINISLHKEASDTIKQKSESLQQLKNKRKEEQKIYEQKITQLRDYKNELLTL